MHAYIHTFIHTYVLVFLVTFCFLCRHARRAAAVGDFFCVTFLCVDMRGADATERQLRDDLMTMLIAGHETTAAMLTWATFCLLKGTILKKLKKK